MQGVVFLKHLKGKDMKALEILKRDQLAGEPARIIANVDTILLRFFENSLVGPEGSPISLDDIDLVYFGGFKRPIILVVAKEAWGSGIVSVNPNRSTEDSLFVEDNQARKSYTIRLDYGNLAGARYSIIEHADLKGNGVHLNKKIVDIDPSRRFGALQNDSGDSQFGAFFIGITDQSNASGFALEVTNTAWEVFDS